MSSLPDCASPPLVPTTSLKPAVIEATPPVAATPKPPRTWYFVGTALFGLFIFVVQNLAEVAVLIALFIHSGAEVRGFLFRGWSQSFLGTTGAIVLSSAIWAGLHTQYNAFYMTQIFLLGLLFATLRHRSGSTWLTVLLHGTYNVAAIIHVVLAVPGT